MIFCGFSGFSDVINENLSRLDEASSIKASSCLLDDMMATNDVEADFSDGILDWDDSTVLRATFEDGYGGSENSEIEGVTELRLRRRDSDSSPWLTIAVRYIDEASDFIVEYYDRFNKSGVKYQYLLVPVKNGEEQSYLKGNMTDYVESKFNGIFVADKDSIWGSNVNISYDRTRNRQTNTITPISSKYPIVVSNGAINYDSGSVTGLFVEYDGDFDFDGGVSYRDGFYDFLTDGFPKILKTYDGMLKMIEIDGEISEQDSGTYTPETTFNWVEIGNAENYDDLYDNGFINYS